MQFYNVTIYLSQRAKQDILCQVIRREKFTIETELSKEMLQWLRYQIFYHIPVREGFKKI